MIHPFEAAAQAFKLGMNTTKENDAPVRVAVYLDAAAPRQLVCAVRDALVPQTTSALVRVERLAAEPAAPKPDTDVMLVIAGGAPDLEPGVRRLATFGAPVCVLAETSVEVPFITADTPLLGLIAATSEAHLLESLARWILDRTEKDAAFAANFPFMREAAANRVITGTALTNMATGALFFVPGANYPVMTMAQLGMMLKLSSMWGYALRPERGYEAAAVAVTGLALRGVSRALCRRAPRTRLVVRALVAGFGTYGMGRALAAAYEHGVDYAQLNAALRSLGARARAAAGAAASPAAGAAPAPVRPRREA